MKSAYIILFVFVAMLSGCTNEQTFEYSVNEQNIKLIQKIACNYGFPKVELYYEGIRTTPLSQDEIIAYENYFKELRQLNGMVIKTKGVIDSRALESDVYYGTASYENHSYNITVYWMKDNQTNEICNIEGGIGGSSLTEYPWPDSDEIIIANGIVNEIIYQGKTLHGASNGIISITIRGDYLTKRYKMNGGRIDFDELYYQTVSKVAADGKVNTRTKEGQFVIHYSGEGSWVERL